MCARVYNSQKLSGRGLIYWKNRCFTLLKCYRCQSFGLLWNIYYLHEINYNLLVVFNNKVTRYTMIVNVIVPLLKIHNQSLFSMMLRKTGYLLIVCVCSKLVSKQGHIEKYIIYKTTTLRLPFFEKFRLKLNWNLFWRIYILLQMHDPFYHTILSWVSMVHTA